MSEEGAKKLHELYVKDLQESLRPPVDRHMLSGQIKALIQAAETLGTGTVSTADA